MLISGCFDILHTGHVEFMEAVKKGADILVVGVLSDLFVKKRKGVSRPVFSQQERIKLIASLTVVDYTFLFDTDEVEKLLQELKSDYYGVGGDREETTLPVQVGLPEKRWLDKYQVKIKYFPCFGNLSTTTIINNLLDKNLTSVIKREYKQER